MSEVRSGMIIAGKVRLETLIARGGMGSVWRARHLMLDKPVAVKFIGSDVAGLSEARKRFEREAKAAALLQSPHVVQIYDYGVEGDVPYLVMELLEGEDLGARLKRKDRLDPEETSSIVVQVARALRRAAEAGIVHRDLKPSNIFILRGEDDDELVKVLDFGIAKAPPKLRVDDDSTKAGAIIGSPRYMSPEQARGSPLVDPRSDLWSLAVIAYRALTGELPFQSTDLEDLIRKICRETPAPPSRIVPALGPDVDAFFVRALDRDPACRFQTAKELAVAFSAAVGEPPPSIGSLHLRRRTLSDEVLVSLPPAVQALLGVRGSGGTSSTPPRALGTAAPAVPASAPTLEAPAVTPRSEPNHVPSRDPPGGETTAPESVRIVVEPTKDTPTPCPSDVDLPEACTPRPPPLTALRTLVLGVLAGALLLLGLAIFVASRPPSLQPAVLAGGSPLPSAPPAPPPEPTARPAASTAPSAEASATKPATSAPPPRRAPLPAGPAHRADPRKKSPILGI
jgi:eukaryotic-like serine/threonine-protein kinase